MPTPPPLPAQSAATFRHPSLPPQLGETVDVFQVTKCSPDHLRLSVSSGRALITAIVSGLIAIIGFIVWWKLISAVANFDKVSGWLTTLWVVALLISIASLVNIGRSMDFDRLRRTARVTWFYFKTKQYPLDRIASVDIEFAKPADATPTKTAPQAHAPAPLVRKAALLLIGTDDAVKPIRVEIGTATLTLEDWPVLGAVAVHLSNMLRVPLRFEGAVDQLSELAKTQVSQFAQLASQSAKA